MRSAFSHLTQCSALKLCKSQVIQAFLDDSTSPCTVVQWHCYVSIVAGSFCSKLSSIASVTNCFAVKTVLTYFHTSIWFVILPNDGNPLKTSFRYKKHCALDELVSLLMKYLHFWLQYFVDFSLFVMLFL